MAAASPAAASTSTSPTRAASACSSLPIAQPCASSRLFAGPIAEAMSETRVWLGFDGWALATARAGVTGRPCDRCSIGELIVAHRRERGLRMLDRDLCRSWYYWQARAATFLRRPPVWRAVKAVAAAFLVHGQLSDTACRELIEDDAFHDGDRRALWQRIGFDHHPLEYEPRPAGRVSAAVPCLVP
jgi:hypothetical protein